MFWVYLYITGYVLTFLGMCAKDAYEDRYMDFDDIAGRFGVSFLWPFVGLYYLGTGTGSLLREKRRQALARVEEEKKLLKEAGLHD